GRTCRCIGREVDCRGTCVDPRFDPAHCGGCNRRCALPNTASHNCVSGQCQVRTCKRGFGNCDGDHATGCETETRSNVDHCGGCLRACPPPRVCRDQGGGTCRCPDDRPNQCGPADDPVCVDFATDGQNCGECGMDCSTNNVSARCVDGQCQFLNCAPGWADCDDDLANGCETSLGGVENCGRCGRRCPACDPGKRRICVGSTYCHCF
ncbi:MAG: hypothetical protein M3464_07235, partial [Chloroflexota bacterium]|nr:hypothetical protein [Chloroflexota bacterium]